jgi:GNAT superfamily N-acetyltransferase
MEGIVRVRPANRQDSSGLARVQVDSYRTAYARIWSQELLDHFTYEEQEQDWLNWMADRPDDLLYVAETDADDCVGGEIVGYALARPGPTEIAGYESELMALHVHPSRYRQGIGRRLFAAVAGQLRRQGCTSMMLWTMEENGTGAAEVAYGWPAIESLCR